MKKYQIVCKKCGTVIDNFKEWFAINQKCPKCGSNHAEIEYTSDYSKLKDLYHDTPDSFWEYFDFLPLENRENIISYKEGAIPIEEWDFLEDYASRKYGINCKVYIYRNDLNGGTNTFKDVAASMAASVFKENGISKYCLASTGNTATAYSKYLTKAGIEFTVFVPNCVNQDTVEEIKSHHQHIVVSDGDYSYAKKLAAEFHKNNGVLISGGNIDPIRVEAKKTMVFEFMRQLGKMPDIYLQAVSGGTGPISIDKGVREIKNFYPEVKLPKMFLVQQDTCNPMVQGWNNAVKNGFPEGYEKDYPAIDNPQTKVSILSTGNPGMFPIVAPIVKKSNGTFLCVKESELLDYARMIKKERNIILGPASIVCFSGFFEALAQNKIENGQTVLINTGEGAARSKDFAQAI
ncbi:MAG: pyridoxal-phosphate dependent enzyme [Bacteroidales bacterium]|jgi:threonine synthase|nr:pyridoxal-phosphate dependent enzyme [Bacteroidales bacterium]MDD2204908.1 pyridoxal-phosphate dependent enzyme [Bacteroidales bacterium]MDD3153133.1 pyridoxal-phosphate dependent enzyme [Bacteroidales bacterium]MDD3914531.1 pyridoxal-phosphate dependent enzyme [Bacteroidales bacterium]MDD4634425.1 pyridoxal-phosphate dependent enzyme [Bacteroidales bacterium]